MSKQEWMQSALDAERCLQEALIEEFRRKAKLGEHVIINRDGQPCKVLAEEALRETEEAYRKKYGE